MLSTADYCELIDADTDSLADSLNVPLDAIERLNEYYRHGSPFEIEVEAAATTKRRQLLQKSYRLASRN